MEYSEQFRAACAKFKADNTDASLALDFSSSYWSMLLDNVGNILHNKGNIQDFIKREKRLLDFGICTEIHQEPEQLEQTICDADRTKSPIKIELFSEYLSDLMVKIFNGDRKDTIIKETRLAKIQIKKLHDEIANLQNERKQRLNKFLVETSSNPSPHIVKQIEKLELVDTALLESTRARRAIAHGAFFSVDVRREHAGKEQQLHKDQTKANTLIESVSDREALIELRKISTSIEETCVKIIEQEEIITKLESELAEIDRKKQEVSPIEIENRIRREIEYMRDLTKLSAKRLHLESNPIIKPGDKHFTYATLLSCIQVILEFDPRLFKNDRVPLFGIPSILLVPGTGNTVYDWKNNRLIVPTIVPGGNYMAGLAAGIIEYRLDVDEDKKLINSYNQIPELKTVKSHYQLKLQLSKDYIVWMTSEYKGFRILSKDKKEWFEHEIAPEKNEIITPLKFQPFMITPTAYKERLIELDKKIKEDLASCTHEDLWESSVMFYQQGNFKTALDLTLAFLQKVPDSLYGIYNAGVLAMKNMEKSKAIEFFMEYSTKNPQSWWCRIARDHLRRMQS